MMMDELWRLLCGIKKSLKEREMEDVKDGKKKKEDVRL